MVGVSLTPSASAGGACSRGTDALPFLAAALERLLEKLPAVDDGLARSERELLEAVRGGATSRHEAFEGFQRSEGRPFMGDTVFWRRVDGLVGARVPLLEENGGLRITQRVGGCWRARSITCG